MPRTLSDKGKLLLSFMPSYYESDPASQAVIDAMAREIALVEDSSIDFLDKCFPQNATDDFNSLSIWEEILGLPVRPTLPRTYPDLVMSDGALAYFRFGAATGTTATNTVKPLNSGTYSGTFALGQPGALTTDANTAAAFDGVTGRVAGMSTPVTSTDNFTLEFWAKPSSLSQNSIMIFNGDVPDVTLDNLSHLTAWRKGGVGVGINNGAGSGNGANLAVWFREETETGSAGSPGTVSTNTWFDMGYTFSSTSTWHHIVVKRDAGVLSAYVDKVQTANTFNTAPPVPSKGFTIAAHDISTVAAFTGAVTPGYDKFFAGSLDEAALYGVALTDKQIANHYTAALSLVGPASFVPDAARRAKVIARLRARRSGFGKDWVALVTTALGTSAWTYFEGPGAYQLTVDIPFAPSSYTAARAVTLIEEVTPANLQLFVNYQSGFIVGVSWLSVDSL